LPPYRLGSLALSIYLRESRINPRLQFIVTPTPLFLKRAHERRLDDLVRAVSKTGESACVAAQSWRQNFDRFTGSHVAACRHLRRGAQFDIRTVKLG
jgi:hypothetical protein